MTEFFIEANSFAAPFVSDNSTHYVEADSAKKALAIPAACSQHRRMQALTPRTKARSRWLSGCATTRSPRRRPQKARVRMSS
jgi:hypothetical protein